MEGLYAEWSINLEVKSLSILKTHLNGHQNGIRNISQLQLYLKSENHSLYHMCFLFFFFRSQFYKFKLTVVLCSVFKFFFFGIFYYFYNIFYVLSFSCLIFPPFCSIFLWYTKWWDFLFFLFIVDAVSLVIIIDIIMNIIFITKLNIYIYTIMMEQSWQGTVSTLTRTYTKLRHTRV